MVKDLLAGQLVTTQENTRLAMANMNTSNKATAVPSQLVIAALSSEQHNLLGTLGCVRHSQGESNDNSITKSSSSVYFSQRIQRMIESRDTFSTELEFDIEYSKSHWTVMEDDDDDMEYSPEADRIYFEGLKKHDQWGEFFKEFDDLVVGEKIGEGAQAEIYAAKLISSNGGMIKSDYYDLVVKVMKRGYALQSLQRQWPLGVLNFARSSSDFCTNPSSICGRPLKGSLNWIKGGTLLKDERLKGQFAFVMDRHWGDLRKLIDLRMRRNTNQGPPFDKDQVLGLMRDIAWDMESLHCNETLMILHRDLKASNVLIFSVDLEEGSDQRIFNAMVIDYECSMGVIGTGFWRAPEILQQCQDRIPSSKMKFTAKADVFSYGMTCYEIITGHMPFGDDALATIDDILSGRRPTLPDDIDPLVKDIIMHCWHPDPLQRPSFTNICTMIHQAINWRRQNQITWNLCKPKEREDLEKNQEEHLKEWGKKREEWDTKWDSKEEWGKKQEEWNDHWDWQGLQNLHNQKPEEEHQPGMLDENRKRLKELEESLEGLVAEQEKYQNRREEQEKKWERKRHELEVKWKKVHGLEQAKDEMGLTLIEMENLIGKGAGMMEWAKWEIVFMKMEYVEWELMSWRRGVSTWQIQREEWEKWRAKVHQFKRWANEKRMWEEWAKNDKTWKELHEGLKSQKKEENEWKEWDKKEWENVQNWWKEWEEWAMINNKWWTIHEVEGLHERQKNAWKELQRAHTKRGRWWKESYKWWKASWKKKENKVESVLRVRENERRKWHEWNEAQFHLGDPLILWRTQLFQQSDSPSPDWLQYVQAIFSNGKHSSFDPLSVPKSSHLWATPLQLEIERQKRRSKDNEVEKDSIQRMQCDQEWHDKEEKNRIAMLLDQELYDQEEKNRVARLLRSSSQPDKHDSKQKSSLPVQQDLLKIEAGTASRRTSSTPVVVIRPSNIHHQVPPKSPPTRLSKTSSASLGSSVNFVSKLFSPSTTFSSSTSKISPSTTLSAIPSMIPDLISPPPRNSLRPRQFFSAPQLSSNLIAPSVSRTCKVSPPLSSLKSCDYFSASNRNAT